VCLERSKEVYVVEGLEAHARACLGGSGYKRIQIPIEGNQQRRRTRGKVTPEVERRFGHWGMKKVMRPSHIVCEVSTHALSYFHPLPSFLVSGGVAGP
jgi:hypothetical protein